jgi:hypothetical protein
MAAGLIAEFTDGDLENFQWFARGDQLVFGEMCFE